MAQSGAMIEGLAGAGVAAQTVPAPAISVPTVTATAGLGASIATDKASYGPDSPVLISTSVVNNAALVQNASVALKVYAPDGQQIADLGVFQASQLPVSGTQAL